MTISELEYLEQLPGGERNEAQQVAGGLEIAAFAFSFAEGSKLAKAFSLTGTVAISL